MTDRLHDFMFASQVCCFQVKMRRVAPAGSAPTPQVWCGSTLQIPMSDSAAGPGEVLGYTRALPSCRGGWRPQRCNPGWAGWVLLSEAITAFCSDGWEAPAAPCLGVAPMALLCEGWGKRVLSQITLLLTPSLLLQLYLVINPMQVINSSCMRK